MNIKHPPTEVTERGFNELLLAAIAVALFVVIVVIT